MATRIYKLLSLVLHLVLMAVMVLGLTACTFSVDKLPIRTQGAVQVTTPDQAFAVYLDDIYFGQTPFFDERIKTGEYVLSLREINSNQSIWQSRIPINHRSLTVVNFSYATNQEQRSSEIVYLEPLSDSKLAKVSITTLPDHVVVKVDGQVQGFSPLSIDFQEAAEKRITLEAPGYQSKTIQAKTILGQHLIIQAQLGIQSDLPIENQPQATKSAQLEVVELTEDARFGASESGVSLGYQDPVQTAGEMVEILNATVGINWLRVRSTPNTLANNEVARVMVGDFYPFIEVSDNNEWSLIEYAPDKQGWVASRYTKLVED